MLVREPFDKYKGNKAFINPSSFKSRGVKTPAHFLYKKEHPLPPNEGMVVGSALHCLVLTPDLFEDEYLKTTMNDFPPACKKTIYGYPNYAEKANKRVKKELQDKALSLRKSLLLPEHTVVVMGMLQGLKSNIDNLNYVLDLKRGEVEVSLYMFAEFNYKGLFVGFRNINLDEFKAMSREEKVLFLPVKTRPDYFHKKKKYAADLKTSRDASPDKFPYEMWEYGYHTQGAFEIDVLNCENGSLVYNPASGRADGHYNTFCLITVENDAPYLAIKYYLKPNAIQSGREDYVNRLRWIRESYLKGKFRGYDIYSTYVSIDEDGSELRNDQAIDIDLPLSYYHAKEWWLKLGYIKPF